MLAFEGSFPNLVWFCRTIILIINLPKILNCNYMITITSTADKSRLWYRLNWLLTNIQLGQLTQKDTGAYRVPVQPLAMRVSAYQCASQEEVPQESSHLSYPGMIIIILNALINLHTYTYVWHQLWQTQVAPTWKGGAVHTAVFNKDGLNKARATTKTSPFF